MFAKKNKKAKKVFCFLEKCLFYLSEKDPRAFSLGESWIIIRSILRVGEQGRFRREHPLKIHRGKDRWLQDRQPL